MGTSRRVFLGLVAATPLLTRCVTACAAAGYASYSEIYRDPALHEGVDWGRRMVRHPAFDRTAFGRTVVFAPHGGGIEPGTSELALAVAGYHPATLAASGAVQDYWMFEGLRASGNAELHVTSTGCDDHYARSLAAGALNAVALHGCSVTEAERDWRPLPNPACALVGGANADLRARVVSALTGAGISAVDASSHPTLDGTDPGNIVNRTLLGAGVQVETTTPLRAGMFTTNTGAQRKHTTTALFWDFAGAVRSAVAGLEATQVIL
ncbi:poly-gamma-glutamate hydrolase family protein [Lentzea sp. NPDC051213]|uniref:poly-gamma-glutamate hydrolase family protein n=1 Tax=Lentzea sp. NPDC051213 TaxID=3364126 RepID=UPI0037A1053C